MRDVVIDLWQYGRELNPVGDSLDPIAGLGRRRLQLCHDLAEAVCCSEFTVAGPVLVGDDSELGEALLQIAVRGKHFC